MKNRKILSLILTICMVLSLVPMVAYAEEVVINGDPINVKVKDYSVDKSSISVDLFVIFRNKETGEEQPREGIDTITPENVTVGTFKTVKTNAIEEAKTKLNEWLERMRQNNPDVQFTVVGDMVVEGDDAEFDNRTYAMIDDEASGSRYMQINGDYGYTGSYSVTMTVEVQAVGDYSIIEGTNGVWTQNSDKTLTFRANGDFSKFTGVKVDGTLIDAKNYTAVSGSTVVTLKAEYLQTLSVGTHKLTIVYTDGECSTNFEVKAASELTKPTEGDKSYTTSPQTGDNSRMLLWVALLFVSGAGVIGTAVYGIRKKRAERFVKEMFRNRRRRGKLAAACCIEPVHGIDRTAGIRIITKIVFFIISADFSGTAGRMRCRMARAIGIRHRFHKGSSQNRSTAVYWH